MDGLSLALFLSAAFVGGVVNGVAGFAMGLIVSPVWLHVLTPIQTTVLIVTFGLVLQSYGIWRLRNTLAWRAVWPFVVGGAIGVPIGTLLLTRIDPVYLRIGVGVLLLLYSVYGLARPTLKPVQAGAPSDLGVGILNGLLSGLTGLGGVIVTVWCQLRAWSKDAQRSVFQPAIFATMALSAVSMAFAGAVTGATVNLFLIGAPLMLAGTWCGHRLYGKLDDEAFRKIILLLLLVSGLTLIVPLSMFQ